jgi:hypothetical protein
MKLLYICLFSTLVLMSSCRLFGGRRIHGDGNIVTVERSAGTFNSLDVRGSIDVRVRQDSSNTIKIQGDQNLMEYIEVSNDGSTLIVRERRGVRLRPTKDLVVFVSAPSYRDISVSGAGDIVSEGTISGTEPMEVSVSGAGDVNMQVNVASLSSRISGSGTMNLKGLASDFSAEVSGAGDIRCFDLITEQSSIRLSGAGEAEITANKNLKVQVSGAGDVRYKGNAAVTQKISGAGSVTKVGS